MRHPYWCLWPNTSLAVACFPFLEPNRATTRMFWRAKKEREDAEKRKRREFGKEKEKEKNLFFFKLIIVAVNYISN
jgi:hypothetical protein